MKVHIDRDVLRGLVRVYIMEPMKDGRVAFLWPVEYEEFGWSWFRQEEGRDAEIRPAIEMALPMWDAFVKALLEKEHVRVDALDIIAKTLEKEQERVDTMITALINTPFVFGENVKVTNRAR